MKRIESRDNNTYRQIAGLRQTNRSRAEGLVFLEGLRLCADALLSGVVPVYALAADSAAGQEAWQEMLRVLPPAAEKLILPDRLFRSLCETEQPQGIALVCRSPLLAGPAGPPAEDGLYLVAEEIQDPGNLGTMIRTADAFGFDAVLLTAGSAYPYAGKVMRAAMGSCFHLPLMTLPDMAATAAWLVSGARPAALLAADPAGQDFLTGSLPVPAALVIGNEARGLSDAARRLCSQLVRIPMPGRAESLNAAAAASILCYELMRSRDRLCL